MNPACDPRGHRLHDALTRNLGWFEKSGVMDPPDGTWGVAERIVLRQDNAAWDETLRSFQGHVIHDGHAVLEQRRPDCNFETALLFTLAGAALAAPEHRRTAGNLLHYLFRRSGSRNGRSHLPAGAWRWSNESWESALWFDDNAWNVAAGMLLARLDAQFDREFHLRERSAETARTLADAFLARFRQPPPPPSTPFAQWDGNLDSPHWGGPVCLALALAHRDMPDARFPAVLRAYHASLQDSATAFSASEHAYLVIGATAAAVVLGDEAIWAVARRSADLLTAQMDPATGNIPSEWGAEAPTGQHLVDLIYTVNWTLLGLHCLKGQAPGRDYAAPFGRILDLVLRLQDRTPEPHLHGCWRGMYDLTASGWGGGDRHEGGAASIYTGWTNAPIACVIALEATGRNLLDL